jgi:general stress protein YciG
MDAKTTRPRGFAALAISDPARLREVARMGGASIPAEKRAYAVDRDLASRAGTKGGRASRGGGRPPGSGNVGR